MNAIEENIDAFTIWGFGQDSSNDSFLFGFIIIGIDVTT